MAASVTVNTGSAPLTISSPHSQLQTFATILAALVPLVEAGVAPFVKNAQTQQLIVSEEPVAIALAQALAAIGGVQPATTAKILGGDDISGA